MRLIPALAFAVCLTAGALSRAGAQEAGPAPALDGATFLSRAEERLEAGDILEALDLYRQVEASAANPEERGPALVRMADIQALFLGDKEQALALYERALASYEGRDFLENACMGSAMLLYEAGRPDEAGRRFAAYLRLHPQGARADTARFMVGRIAREQALGLAPAPAMVEPYRPAGEPEVRVLLGRESRSEIALDQGGELRAASGSGAGGPLSPGAHEVEARSGNVVLDGHALGPGVEIAPAGGRFGWDGKEYGGSLVLLARGGRLELVNRAPMETYLRGVVGREMPADFAPQALRAQAVASRTYAANLLAASQGDDFDLRADTGSQVYGGIRDAAQSVDQAVVATRGEMLLYGGRPALCCFHSHSGGVTEDDAGVWGSNLPYLVVGDDTIAQMYKPLYWEQRFTAGEIAAALKNGGYAVSRVLGVEAAQRSSSGRMTEVGVTTGQGSLRLGANAFRLLLGPGKLKSLLCVVRPDNGDFVFSGRGLGHGVGMSQWGAQAMAADGAGYEAILARYYPGTQLTKLY